LLFLNIAYRLDNIVNVEIAVKIFFFLEITIHTRKILYLLCYKFRYETSLHFYKTWETLA